VALFVVVVGGYLVAQLWLAFEVIRGVFVLPLAILPGPGRAAVWQWVGGVLRAVLTLFLSLVFLALFMTFVQVLLEQTNGQALIVSFVVIDVAAFAALVFHRRLLNAGQRAAATVTARLAHDRPLTGPPVVWVRTGAPPTAMSSFVNQGKAELRTAARPITEPARLTTQAARGIFEAGSRARQRGSLPRSNRGRRGAGAAALLNGAGAALRGPGGVTLRGAGAALRGTRAIGSRGVGGVGSRGVGGVGSRGAGGGAAGNRSNGRADQRTAALRASLRAARAGPIRRR
jgi:hypothetical protein